MGGKKGSSGETEACGDSARLHSLSNNLVGSLLLQLCIVPNNCTDGEGKSCKKEATESNHITIFTDFLVRVPNHHFRESEVKLWLSLKPS